MTNDWKHTVIDALPKDDYLYFGFKKNSYYLRKVDDVFQIYKRMYIDSHYRGCDSSLTYVHVWTYKDIQSFNREFSNPHFDGISDNRRPREGDNDDTDSENDSENGEKSDSDPSDSSNETDDQETEN